VKKATPAVVVTPGAYTYSGSFQGPGTEEVNPGGSTGPISLRYTGTTSSGDPYDSDIPPTLPGDYSVTATTAEDENYASAESTATAFTIAKGTPVIITAPSASDIIFGQTLASSILTGGDVSLSLGGAGAAGSFAFTTPSTSPNVGTANQNVTFTPTDTANFNTVTTTVSVTVNSAGPIGSTFTSVGFEAGTENNIAANGLSNLMNYALGQNGPNAPLPAKPVLNTDSSGMTLSATARTDDSSLKFYVEWTTDLSGVTDSWNDHSTQILPPDLTGTITYGGLRKFLRFKVTTE
jgi:hypothetical protein